jgi:BirA family biotin operon repressor/biotin-[acetyl-CoA-carboxylase] ligase
VNGKKICGILAEMSTRAQEVNYVVLGIGINANTFPKIVPESIKATSIERELGRQICLEELLVATLEKMEKIYKQYEESQFCSVLAEWKELACFLGKRVRVISGNESFQGVAVNVDSDGVLVLRLEDGTTKRVFSGDLIIE